MLLLGQIPTFSLGKGGRQPIATSLGGAGQAVASEAFRVLGVNTLAVMADRQPRTLMLSSAEPGAGKSLLAANLAAALAQTGLRVILVDGDLHHPRLHTLFDLPREPGLSDVVRDPGKLDGALQTTPALGVQLLASGSSRAAQGNLYHMPSVFQVMQALATRADIVLWDSPPILATADAAVLATQVQGVILVATRDHTSRRSLALALQELQQVGAQTLGMIYNRATLDGAGYYYRSYHRQADAPSAEAPPAANTHLAAEGRRQWAQQREEVIHAEPTASHQQP